MMAQDVSGQDYPNGEGQQGGQKRSSIWPWLLLVAVVFIVVFLLWLYWRTPPSETAKVIDKTTEIPVELPKVRPEPIVPDSSGIAAETSAVLDAPATNNQVGITSRNSQQVAEVTMPGITGLSQADAESKVKAAGLVPYLTYGDDPSTTIGHVISQWPLKGETLPRGSEGFIQIQLK